MAHLQVDHHGSNSQAQPSHQLPYKLAHRLAVCLRLEAEPLALLPLVVWRSQGAQCVYAFPLETTGRWVCDQGASVACMFLADFLSSHHRRLLSDREAHLLQASVHFAQAVLRCMQPYLPGKGVLMQAHTRVAHVRLPFKDGWLDAGSLAFNALPYQVDHYVFGATIAHSYEELMGLTPAYLEETAALLADYMPMQQERDWLVRYLGRCLCPADGSKALVVFTDSLDAANQPGNAAKSTLLRWVQTALGNSTCTISAGDLLTVARSHTTTAVAEENGNGPSIQCFGELTRAQGNGAAQRLDYGRLKFLTNGSRGHPGMVIAANIGDLPDLVTLQQSDAAFVSRVVALPARARFLAATDITFNIHTQLDHLAKGLCRLLLDGFKAYREAGNKLLPVPASMQTFKSLAMRCSALFNCSQQQVAYAKDWAHNTLCFGGQQNLPANMVQQLFTAACSTLHVPLNMFKQPSRIQADLLDAILASFGVAYCKDTQDYVGVWLKAIQARGGYNSGDRATSADSTCQ